MDVPAEVRELERAVQALRDRVQKLERDVAMLTQRSFSKYSGRP